MKRSERNDYNYIKGYKKRGFTLGQGTVLTIPTDGSEEFKRALHSLYTGWGFHPAGITTDPNRFDDRERITYIFGLTFEMNGEEHPWTELYTDEERSRYAAALD